MSLDEAKSGFLNDAAGNIRTAVNYLLIGEEGYGFISSASARDLSRIGDLDVYALNCAVGQSYTLRVSGADGRFGQDVTGAAILLMDSSGNIVGTSSAALGYSYLEFTATSSVYYASIISSSIGYYELEFIRPQAGTADFVVSTIYDQKSSIAGSIEFVSDVDSFQKYMTAGTKYYVSAGGQVADFYFDLEFNEEGIEALFPYGSSPTYFTVPEDGIYQINVSSNSFREVGNYQLLLGEMSAVSDAYVALPGQSLVLGATAGVLSNDEAASALSAQVVRGPVGGTLSLLADGSFSYTPRVGFAGIDSFRYRATDQAELTDEADVLLYVTPVNNWEGTSYLGLLSLTPEEQIASTYVAFFGRCADAPGFKFWLDQFDYGINVLGKTPKQLFADIASSFGISDEAKALYAFLASPGTATDTDIGIFLGTVYQNMFNRRPDDPGLAYWTGRVKEILLSGAFVGDVLVDIMSGAQNSGAGQDITTLMSKVAVGLHYIEEADRFAQVWTHADDGAEAKAILASVTAEPTSLMQGLNAAEEAIIRDLFA